MGKFISLLGLSLIIVAGCTFQEDGIDHFVSTIDEINISEAVITIDCSFLTLEEGENALEYVTCYVDAQDTAIVNEADEELSYEELETGTDIEVELEETQPPSLIEGEINAERLTIIEY
ncbi:hypothetical protein [Evansella clarkii]|uniref:hypothetical protein n=1 Tax=Evansella clarkii TaxID=79879 RepID=UPI000998534C|nr:hypothetical protein [Evansella clarkii]